MNYSDLNPKTAAALEIASHEQLFSVLQELIDAGLDAHVVLCGTPPRYRIQVLALAGSAVHHEIEIPIDVGGLDDWVRLSLLAAYVDQAVEQNRRWVRRMNVKLTKSGLAPMALPEFST